MHFKVFPQAKGETIVALMIELDGENPVGPTPPEWSRTTLEEVLERLPANLATMFNSRQPFEFNYVLINLFHQRTFRTSERHICRMGQLSQAPVQRLLSQLYPDGDSSPRVLTDVGIMLEPLSGHLWPKVHPGHYTYYQ